MKNESFSLNRVHQCKKCPWKVGTNPHEIPGNYCEQKHRDLQNTIANGFEPGQLSGPLHIMACHHSKPGKEDYCIGWLNNQLGVGNNIALRLKFRNCTNIMDVVTTGPQHQRFEDTLPKGPEVFPWSLDSLIPFGPHGKSRIKAVPASYLIPFLEGKNVPVAGFDRFLKSIEDLIRSPDWGTFDQCKKVYFLTRQDAQKRLKTIQMNEPDISDKKPVRSYECEKCGFWHLTSKPL